MFLGFLLLMSGVLLIVVGVKEMPPEYQTRKRGWADYVAPIMCICMGLYALWLPLSALVDIWTSGG